MHPSARRIQFHTLLCAAFFVIAGTVSPGHAGEKASLRFSADTPRARQLELARSAAPPEISDQATLYVLGPKGYEVAQQGSNGFSCLVEREIPETQEPECFDAEGSATTLPARLRVEELRAQGGGGGQDRQRNRGGLQDRQIQSAAQDRHRLHVVHRKLGAGRCCHQADLPLQPPPYVLCALYHRAGRRQRERAECSAGNPLYPPPRSARCPDHCCAPTSRKRRQRGAPLGGSQPAPCGRAVHASWQRGSPKAIVAPRPE